jgi:hypothetical protein
MTQPGAGESGGVLNAHQRRHFEVVLGMLEATIGRIEQLAEAGPSKSMLTIDENDLPPDFATDAAPHLTAVRDKIATLAAELQLQPRRVSRRRAMRALLTAEVVRLQDSSAAQLRGYGAVDPRFAERVAPALADIIDRLGAVSSQLATGPRSTR